MLPICTTTHAVLMCAVADQNGVLRVPLSADAGATPGLLFSSKPLTPINVQLVEAASAFFGKEVGPFLHIEQHYHDLVPNGSGEDVALYVARLGTEAGIVAAATWPSIPDLLRQLAGRVRIPYLRAWQVLAGGLQLQTKAVEAAEVAKYFDD